MISVSAAKSIIRKNVSPLAPTVSALENAAYHVLADDIYSRYDIPAFRQSSMDGYAVKFDDRVEELTVVGEMAAGAAHELTIKTGEACRIFTGAPLPAGADTVVMQEKIGRSGDKIRILDTDLQRGANVRARGSETSAGALAMQHGALLTPAAIGFLAGIGVTGVSIYPAPIVAIISTGKELQQPGQDLKFGQVYESNSYSLSAALKKEGIETIALFTSDDELNILTHTLQKALAIADVVLLTGGVSVGDYDFVIEASRQCGVAQLFHKVKQKPGKPLFFGKKEEKLVFGLPGNPSSVLNCYYNYVLPSIQQLTNKESGLKEVTAVLTHGYQKAAGLSHFLKGNFKDGKATPLSAQESYRMSSFAQANCLICLPENEEQFTAGQQVTLLLFPD